MASIVYLDVDDEITSAAARIRGADDRRVALVVPYGSRLATSRINFRLLAREAQSRERRLSIVAGDAGTRALAASAGLPAFGSVGEYEAAEAEGPAGPAVPERNGSPEGAPAVVAAGGAAAAVGASDGDRTERMATAATPTPTPTPSPAPVERTRPAGGSIPVIGSRRGLDLPFGRNVGLVIAGAVALALLAIGVAAYLLLPSADITIATRTESIGPVPLEVRADPGVEEPDPATATVPAERLSFDVAASGTFPTTGRRVEETTATGRVTFRSKDPISENRIAGGAVVATPNGIRFRTAGPVTIPKATIVGLTIVPGEASVAIEAVQPGPNGNVEANAITVIPGGEDPTFTEVRNPAPTSGGTREEFQRVDQADIDAALVALRTRLDEEFEAILGDPNRTPAGLTLFLETRDLEEPLPTTDPATLLNQEVAEFTLGLATTGSVIAVDEAPVEVIARTRISSEVDTGYRLVEDSIEVVPGEPIVEGESITFPVTASAAQIRILDVDALRAQIKGKPLPQARTILEPYGEVEIRVWPDWVTAIPTLDGRVTMRVEAPEPGPGGSPSARPSARPSPSAGSTGGPAPSGSPGPSGTSGPASPSASVEPGLEGEAPPP